MPLFKSQVEATGWQLPYPCINMLGNQVAGQQNYLKLEGKEPSEESMHSILPNWPAVTL